jgi:hypothetical protein
MRHVSPYFISGAVYCLLEERSVDDIHLLGIRRIMENAFSSTQGHDAGASLRRSRTDQALSDERSIALGKNIFGIT